MNELKPVAYRHRWFDASPHTVTSGQWYPWEYCDEKKHLELLEYIADGYKYETEPLYAIPDTHRVVSVELLRDVLSYCSTAQLSQELRAIELRAIIDKEST